MAADSYGPKNQPQYSGAGAPDEGADLTQVAAYAARVGNHVIGTRAQRQALVGNDLWAGLSFYETDTDLLFRYRGGSIGWQGPALHTGGTFYAAVADDGTTAVAHGLGVIPDDVQITAQSHPTNDQISLLFEPVLFGGYTASRFFVRLKDMRTNTWASPQTFRFQWHAFARAQ
jgi:hypothetical protein